MTSALPEQPSGPAGTSAENSGPSPQKPTEDPDRALVDGVIGGNKEDFDSLVHRHQDRVYSRIYFMVKDRELAADLAQEAFIKAYRNIDTFRRESRFGTWLGRIAVNVTLHHFERCRAQKRSGNVVSIHAGRSASNETRDLEIEDSTHNPYEWVVRKETQRAILEAVAELDDEYRMALALRELHGQSYQEVSATLGIPVGTVKSKIFRARQILQEKLKGML